MLLTSYTHSVWSSARADTTVVPVQVPADRYALYRAVSFQYGSHKYRRRALHMADKVSPAVWPDKGVSYYPDLAFPYYFLAPPTACSSAGCHVQRISIWLCLKPKRHEFNAQCIYSFLYSERLGYCLRLDLTNFTPTIHAYMILF